MASVLLWAASLSAWSRSLARPEPLGVAATMEDDSGSPPHRGRSLFPEPIAWSGPRPEAPASALASRLPPVARCSHAASRLGLAMFFRLAGRQATGAAVAPARPVTVVPGLTNDSR
ncbi:UNVERIFIED_CONTAM: hypothetical protein K2H54_042171 [Gekko kuhli]